MSRLEQLQLDQAINEETREFLAWVARETRTYADAMEVWQTSCPRHSVWEDALGAGLVHIERADGAMGQASVVLTPRGRALLVHS